MKKKDFEDFGVDKASDLDKDSDSDKKEKEIKELEDTVDRYHYKERKLARAEERAEEAEKKADRSTGKGKIKALQEELDLREEALKSRKDLHNLETAYLKIDKQELEGYYNAQGKKVKGLFENLKDSKGTFSIAFDENGEIANYDRILNWINNER
jgi:uncharacterized protein involved in type VI secretion and phage assembly